MKLDIQHILLLHFVFFIKIVSSDWASPFFISERDDVIINLLKDDYVSISMNEEIASPFTLCYLNEYTGTNPPKITQFSIGEMSNLGMKFERFESKWNLIISKTQDYEKESNRRYIFDMEIATTVVTVDIIVLNIFDNIPTVFYENPCSVPELADPIFVSECAYIITDVDGMAGNKISFEIQGNFNENEIFDFKLNEELNEEYIQTYKLVLKQKLFYDVRFFYSFRVKVSDAGNNSFLFNIIVEVEDVPNKPPMWIRVFASEQFPEKESQEFETKAIDGDTGINADICYLVEFEDRKDFSELISINKTSGKIYVKSIDRDALKIEVFPFFIKAYECQDEESWIRNSAVLLVEDKNDNIPTIFFPKSMEVIEIYEETFYKLFNLDELTVEDRDLGTNAMYNVNLDPEHFASALNIIPESGYQLQGFTISVLDPSKLDFEVPEFQQFNISIKAIEVYAEDHWSEKTFEIHLLNWNDELPKFENDEYIFEIKETVGKNFPIGAVKANDRDIGDIIEYYISEKTGEKFSINLLNGELSTLLDGTFDYEQQAEVSFQIFARDTLQTRNETLHTTSTQVQINVIDVNDTPPNIELPRKFLTITENDLSTLITDEIKVTDPDTNANLKLFINWDLSIATGLDVHREDFEECVEIFTESPDKNKLIGTLKSSPTKIIDYEKFQVLFLTITAVDLNTEVNDNSTTAVLTVFIIDENDNAPEFVGNTLDVKRSVIEESESDIFIGFIHAIDIDGPGNNDITFSLVPHDVETNGWIKIDSKSGELAVDRNEQIDCDVPKRFSLEYEVNISDGKWNTVGNISIFINDKNNKVPQFQQFENVIEIYEDVSDYFLVDVKSFDLDRDDPHNVIQYSISNAELQRYFSIDLKTGELRVKKLDEFNQLDRDTEPSEYFISIYIEDNLGIGARNGNYTTVHIILLDVNDNAPQMPSSLDFVVVPIYENFEKSATIVEQFYAPDIDEGLNGQVLYEILSIEPVEIDRELTDFGGLFVLENFDNKYARIKAGIDFKGYSGTWKIEILASDRGNETQEGFSQNSKKSYEIKIEPINYNIPEITFPSKDNSVIRLDHGAADIRRSLILLNGSRLFPFTAHDDDSGAFGDVKFEIESEFTDIFEFFKIDRKVSDLHIKHPVEEKLYEISIHAVDGGNLRSDKMSVSLAFIDKASQPYFDDNQWSTIFTENELGLEEIRQLPTALDVKNVGIKFDELEFEIFYYLDETYRPDDAKLFTLNPSTRALKLKEMLDRESIDHHSIRIFASNEDVMPPLRLVSEKSMLYIDIAVEDVNDNPPSFLYSHFTAGISERDNLGKILMTLEATDPDLNDVVTYYLLKETIKVSNDELNYLKDSAFLLSQNSGALTLNFEVQSSMSGYFEFQAEARDLVNHTDTTDIKIFIVAEVNRVKFIFLNNVEQVKVADQSLLIQIFSDAYDAECVIDDILPHQTSSGVVNDNETDLRVHFIKDNEAIDADDIAQKSSEIAFITELSSKLSKQLSLTLKGLPTNAVDNENKPNNYILEIALISTSSILFVILMTVMGIFIIKGRNLKRQIKALSEKKFDVDATKFNNIKALPNTNIYSGQNNQFNPVMGNGIENTLNDFDTKSIISKDSDDFADLSKTHIFDIAAKDKDSTFA